MNCQLLERGWTYARHYYVTTDGLMVLERWGHKPSLVTTSLTLTLLELIPPFTT